MALLTWTDPLFAGLGWTSSDQSRAEALIDAVGASMARWCNRSGFEAVQRDNVFTIKSGMIFLDAYPVVGVSRVQIDRLAVLTPRSSATVASWMVSSTGVTLVRIVSGLVTATPLLFATYPTIGTLAAAIEAVDTWSVQYSAGHADFPSVDLVSGQTGSNGCSIDMWIDGSATFQSDTEKGVVSLLQANSWLATGNATFYADRARVVWTGGYSTIPDDLQNVCAECVKHYWGDQKAGALTAETIGKYSYSVGAIDMNKMPVSVLSVLSSYKNRVA